MIIIKLDKAEIQQIIEKGNNYEGAYVLLVRPEEYQIAWKRNNGECRQQKANDLVFPIPALDPDGSGQESEDAEWFLENASEVAESMEEIQEIMEDKDWSHTEFCENRYAEEWAENRRESVRWLAENWLLALNGEGNDLPARDQFEVEASSQFRFTWTDSPYCG